MRYWYDTEFLEDGERIWPISIGVVSEDDREYYAVNAELGLRTFDSGSPDLHYRVTKNPWLMKHVVPWLPLAGRPALTDHDFHLDMNSPIVKPWWVVRNEIRVFLTGEGVPAGDPGVELWAWYGAYDHVLLAQTFGRMIDLPSGIPMWTNDLRQEIHRLGITEAAVEKAVPDIRTHEALSDAYVLRDRYWWVREQADGR